jgi:GxxExxY protein
MMKNPKSRLFEPIPQEVEVKAKVVLDAAFRVHSALGPGLLESVYETCLAYEVRESGLHVETQVLLPVEYKGVCVEAGLRLDMLVENCLIIEVKAVEELKPIHDAQLLTYLRTAQVRLGFLINFNVLRLKDGIKRMVV